MHIYFYILFFILGLVIGSFLNVCIFRIPLKKSIVFPASHCFHCKHELKPLDLLPFFSFFILKGKCRYCGEKISIQYPLIELVTGLLFLFVLINYGLSFYSFFYMIFISLLLIVAIIDYKKGIIPNVLILFGLIFGMVYNISIVITTYSFDRLKEGIIGFLVGTAIIFIIILVSRGGMGAGDLKLMGVIGLFLGYKGVILTIFLGVLLGGIFAIIILIAKLKERKSTIPFGPFLCMGAFIALIWGEPIIRWYLLLY